MIDTAVLKGQIELLAFLSNDALASKRAYVQEIQRQLRKQLDHMATEERGPLTANEMHPDIDDTPEDWDEGKSNCEIQGYCSCVTGYCLK